MQSQTSYPIPLSMAKILNKLPKPLTDKQYLTLRDAGLVGSLDCHTGKWYGENKEKYVTNNHKNPILNSQLLRLDHFIEQKLIMHDVNTELLNYGEARKLIRAVSKFVGQDQRYIRLIENYEKNNKYDKVKYAAKKIDKTNGI